MNQELIDLLFDGKRFAVVGEGDKAYKFDKVIFNVFSVLMLFAFVCIFLYNGSDKSDHIHYVCNRPGMCENPFYNNYPICEKAWSTACTQEYVSSGFEYGKPKPFIVQWWGLFVGIGLLGAFVINHFQHNKGYKFSKIELDEGGAQ